MEKIKNLIHPGKSKDDEVMYGSGQSGDPVHAGTGNQATSSDPISTSTNPASESTREPVGQGGIGSVQQGSDPISSSRMPDSRDPLDTNKALPREPTTRGTDSDLDGSRGLGSQTTTGAGLTGSKLPDRSTGNVEGTSDSGRSFPLGGASSGTTTAGPHTSNIANKADPRVDSDRDGSRGLGGTTGYGTGTGATVGSTHQGDLSRSNVGGTTVSSNGQNAPRGYGEESWTHDHGKHGHRYAGDPCENEPPAPGAPHFTSGPHSLDTANRLDPHVSGGGITSTPSSNTETTVPQTTQHHHGRDAAVGAGVGAADSRGYETSRDVPNTTSATTQHDRSTAGPHNSDLLNKADPRVDSDLSKQQGSTTTPSATGLGTTSSSNPAASGDHHHGKDAALAGLGGAAGASAYGAEENRDRDVPGGVSSSGYSNPYPPSSTGTAVGSGLSSSTAPSTTTGAALSSTGVSTAAGPTATGKDHHYGRDAGLAGVGAGAAYEADKNHRHPHDDTTGARTQDPISSQQPVSGVSGPAHGRDTGLPGAGTTAGNQPTTIPDSRHQPSTTTGQTSQLPPNYDDRSRTGESHAGRDAALGAGVGAAAVASEEQLSKKDLERQQKAEHKQELKEQEAAHKQELKEEKKQHHEQEKAEKAHEKAIAKDEKKHQHEQEKAEKAHEKALAKEEKHHQHEQEKAEKAHEKALAKEESKHQQKEEPQEGEKKHHGILGLFHRDKPDKELKEDEIARKERLEQEAHPGAGTAAGAGTAGAGTAGLSEKEKHMQAKEHDRNRLHKDPPPGFGETEYAEAPKTGYASQVTGGTGTTALAQGNEVSRGSHLTALGNKGDPSVTGRGETVDSDRTRDNNDRIVEPQTGLPVNAAGQSSTEGTTTSTAGSAGQGEGFGHFQDHSR